jgi:ribosomal-protein-alanine N-acetyltransferase
MIPAIADVGAAHAAVLAAIHAESFPADPWNEQAFRSLIPTPGTFALLAGTHGLALARVVLDESELLSIAVLPRSRRRGLGAALLDRAMHVAFGAGARTMHLEVSDTNGPAQGLYFSRGFRQVGRRAAYYADGSAALLLAAPLIGVCAATGG